MASTTMFAVCSSTSAPTCTTPTSNWKRLVMAPLAISAALDQSGLHRSVVSPRIGDSGPKRTRLTVIEEARAAFDLVPLAVIGPDSVDRHEAQYLARQPSTGTVAPTYADMAGSGSIRDGVAPTATMRRRGLRAGCTTSRHRHDGGPCYNQQAYYHPGASRGASRGRHRTDGASGPICCSKRPATAVCRWLARWFSRRPSLLLLELPLLAGASKGTTSRFWATF